MEACIMGLIRLCRGISFKFVARLMVYVCERARARGNCFGPGGIIIMFVYGSWHDTIK